MAKLKRRCDFTAGQDSAALAKPVGAAEQAVEQQIKEIEPEEARERKITYRTQVSKTYSKKNEVKIFAQAGSALAHVLRQFINSAWKYTFLDRSKNSGASFITNATQFNGGIRKMKNSFCDQMIKYLHLESKYPYRPDTGLPELFTPQGAAINPETKIPYYVELMHDFEELFFGNFDIKGHPAKHPEQFNAFAAFYIMNNFDDLVEEQLDGIINISTANKGKLNNVSYAKEVARQSSVYWAGETHEAKNIENFTSHLAKLIISTIPKVVDVSTKEDLARGIHRFKQIGDQYLTPSDIYMIAGIIKQAEHDFNIIHQNDIKEGRVKPIVFNDNPKEALRRLLNDKSIPVMRQFGFDLTTSLRAFLYDDTDSEYSVHSLFERGIALDNQTLDIEQLIAFELNKNVTPTYLEYSDFGEVQTKNYGKRYQASSRLSDNIRNLAFLESYNPTPIFTESAYNAIKSKSLAQLGREQSNIFQITCKEIFDIDDITLPQYTEFLEKHLDTIKKICEGLCKVHDPNHGIKKSDDVQERAIETANFLSTFVYGPIKGQEQQLKWDANRYLSSIPMTNFDNLSGSSIPVYRLSSALFQYVQFIQNFHKEDPNRNKLNFFVENQLVLSQYTERPKDGEAVNTTKYNQYYTTPAGFMLDAGSSDASSDIDKMHPNDQLFASFMGNWQSLKELGMFACQIAPYSDKSSIGVILANIDAQVFDPTNKSMEGQVKSLKQIINSDDAPSVLSRMDYHYRKNSKMKLANNILKAWNTISRQLGLEPACSFLSEAELTAAYDKDSFDTTILEQIDQLDHWLQVNGKNLDWDKVALAADKSEIELSDNVFYASLSKGKKSVICFNQSLKWMIKNLSTLQSFRDYEKTLADRFLESPEVKFLKSRLVNPQIARRLIGSGIEMKKRNAQQLYWTGIIQRKEVMQKNKAGKNVKKIVFELDEAKFKKALISYHYANNLIRSQYMDLISKDAFADKGSGKFAYEDLTSDEIAAKLDAIESKRFAGEPISKEDEDFANEVLFTYGESEYSARVAGMAKRMVLYPATIENFSQNTLRGVSPMVHVAIVKDVDEQVWNLKGETHGQEIFDGSGWVSVYYSYMENASLPGRGVKGTKKTLGVHVSDDNSALFKWAEFELNNDRIRRSRGNKYELFNLFKKMHSKYTFGDEVDLTESYVPGGRKLTNPTALVKRRIFYRDGFNDYEISKFSKVGPSIYSITVLPVNTKGEPIKDSKKTEITRKVNSIFDLWMLFGSYNSMELDENGELTYSDINNELIYNYITRVGKVIDPTKALTQDNVYLPLRNAFVSIVATKAAVKRGASNLNSGDSVWNSDNELATFNVSTKNFGVQLDANHHADMAQLTEMTQTISALAANGHTAHIADQAYSAIADIIRGSLKSIKDKNLKIEQGDIELVLQDLSKSLVEALATEKNLSTAQSLISAIERTLQGTLTLPISDKRFYKVFAKKIFGDLNKSSIKRKYTGLGGILNPSGNVLQLYQIGNKPYLFEDLVKLARKTFVKQERFGINAYFEANPGVDKCQVLAQLLILRESNPETELFAPITGKDVASIERYKAETISRIAHALDPEVYGKMPGYGLKLVDLGDVQVLDSVAYYDANSDLTKAPVALELTNIKDYLNLKWNVKPTAVYFNATKPHDLRPQIEHWTCEERYVQDSSKKDTWSEPSLFMLYNIEYMLDAKKKRWEDPILASAAKNSKWAMMLKGLLYNQELYKMFHDPAFASVPDAQKNQIALNNAEKTINDLLSTDSSVRTLTKIQVKKLLENLRMRAAELRAHGFDFGRLVELENGTGYDFNRYFCGYTFDISKEIKADSPMLQEATSIMAKTVDYKVDPAEVIMPKLYKSNYNLGNINLSEIDANYFAKANSFYTCSLITGKGESLAPVDFLVRTHTGNFNVVFYNKFADISEVYGEDITSECRFQDGWRLDEDGNKMYRIPQKGNFAIFVNANGVETLVIRNNQDVEKTMRNLLKSLDSKESSTPLVSIQPFLQTLNTKISLTPKLIDLCISMNHIKTHNQILLEDRNLKGDRLVEALLNVYTSREQLYKKDLANTLYNSFVKTLDIICTRIPTQALQSFMAMHVAALTNDESNNVFVTRWQLWLQGSDLDIDKAYMMGVDVNRIGTYNHWSPLADYTTSELTKISDSLPLPSHLIVSTKSEYWKYRNPELIGEAPDQQIDPLLLDYLFVSTAGRNTDLADLRNKYGISSNEKLADTIQQAIKVELLKIINERQGKISMDPLFHENETIANLFEQLNRHNAHVLTGNESRNCVAKAIAQVSLDGRNMLSGYSPIDRAMALFTDELANHTFSAQLRNLDDTVSIMRIQYENAVGKQDVGIMANGLKAYFAMTQYFNSYWNSEARNQHDRGKFIRALKIGKIGEAELTVRETIADTKIDDVIVSALYLELQRLDPKMAEQVKKISTSNDDASLLISSLVSLATDNAKELALAKLNAGINLACIHVFLTVMGYSAADIVSYTTSDLFKDFTTLITPSQFDKDASDRISDKTWGTLYSMATDEDTNYTLEDVAQLRRIYDSAQEMTSLAKMLGINQGMKVDEFIAASFVHEFENLLPEQFERVVKKGTSKPDFEIILASSGMINPEAAQLVVASLGLPETSELINKFALKIADVNRRAQMMGVTFNEPVDMHRYFTDEEYRELIVDTYDIFKENFNIYDILNNSKHFYQMLNAFDDYMQLFINASSRAKFALIDGLTQFNPSIVNNQEQDPDTEYKYSIYDLPFNYDAEIGKKISRLYDDYILSEFLQEETAYDFKVTFPGAAALTLNINYGKDIKTKNKNLAKFIEFVNLRLIPELRRQHMDNKFVQSIRPDLDAVGLDRHGKVKQTSKTQIGWKFNFDIDHLTDAASESKYNDVIGGFDELMRVKTDSGERFLTLQDVFPSATFEFGGDIKVGDILYLYDQILNFASFGQGSLDKAFERYIQDSPEIPLKIAQIELEHDKGMRQINIDPHILMAHVLRATVVHNSKARGVVKFKDNTSIDLNNSYLLCADSLKTSANNHYKKCAKLLDAIRFNLINIYPVC